jgi:hypothetical protein
VQALRGVGRLLAMSAATLAVLAVLAAGAGANHSVKEQVSVGPAGGNGAFDVFFDAPSADGSRAFFDTDEKLVAGDTDSNYDLYERRGAATTLLSTGTTGGNGAFDVFYADSSDDGTRAFFETDEKLTAADTDSSYDVYERAGGTTTLVSTGAPGGNGAFDVTFHAASRDGTRVFFESDEQLVGTDTDNQTDIYQRFAGTTTQVSIGPAAGNGPFFVAFGGVSDDGTRVFFETDEQLVAADTDAFYDVYERSGGTTSLVSTGPAGGNANLDAGYRDISADGTRVFFQTAEVLVAADTDAQSDVYERFAGAGPRPSSRPARAAATAPSTPTSWAPRWTAAMPTSGPRSPWSPRTPTPAARRARGRSAATSTSTPAGRRP